MVDGAVPDAADKLNQAALVESTVAVQAIVPVPALEIARVCAAGSPPPTTVYAYAKVVGVTDIVDWAIALTPIASIPATAATAIVWYPVNVDGNCATIAVFDHEVVVSVVGEVEPAGVAVTLQLTHCVPRDWPLMVITVPEVTANPVTAAVRGVTETTAAPNLQRVAAK